MKMITRFLCVSLLVFANAVYAEVEPYVSYVPVEIPASFVRLSNDGTGIVKGVSCDGCSYKFLKVTKNSKAYASAKLTDIRGVRDIKNKMVYVKFARATGEVIAIYW